MESFTLRKSFQERKWVRRMAKVLFEGRKELDYRVNEAYKSLRTNVQFSGTDVQVIDFTSCTPNEGKSSVSFNLAVSFADSGKRVVMVDDSIVRGTTSGHIVKMLKDAGATEVHVRISSPPFLHPCYFGTDIPSEDQLIAYGKTLDEIRDSIEADTLAYLGMERLKELNNGLPYCDACFSGNYPIEPPTQDIRGEQG